MKRILPLLTLLMQFNLAFTMSGSGTSSDPYLVSTASDLATIAGSSSYWFSGVYIKQTADIDISSYPDWSPIAPLTTSPFYGDYNGNGYKVTGLTITSTHNGYLGLFGVIGSAGAGSVRNLGVTNGSITTGTYVGMLVGRCAGTITNCYSTGTISCTTSTYVGGLVGLTYIGCTISNSYSSVNCSSSYTSTSSCVGGLTGGITGNSTYSSTIQNCYSTGSATQSSTGYAGGFIGLMANSYLSLTNCYSTGAVSGTNKGGFAAKYTAGTITACYFDYETAGTSTICASGTPSGITAATTTTMKTPSTFTTAGWSTSIWDLIANNYPRLVWQVPVYSTFSGTGNWSEAARWSNGLPGSTTDVTISGTCTVDANYTVVDLTITNGYVLHIDPLHILTVSGTLANNAGATGLILESDATGTGMLMNNSTGVQASVEQFLKKYQWHFMGIPVTGIPDVSVPLHGCYVIWIDESDTYDALSTGWQYLASGNSMKVMGGYAVRFGWDASLFPKSVDTTVTFSGILNTGVQDTIFDSETEGWNFISNPYPVTLNWEGSGKTITNGNDAFYLWNPNLNSGTGSYGSYGSYVSGGSTNGQTQYIPPMQGFFFQVWATNAAISFDNTCKASISSAVFCDAGILHENEENIFRTEMAVPGTGIGEPYIKMAITSNGINYDETLIRVNDRATELFDGHYDAAKLKAIDTRQSQIFTVNDGIEYSINTLPEFSEKTVIPLRIMINETGKHMLTLKEMSNKRISCPLTLYDYNGKALANLSETIFNFEGQKGEIKSFYLGLGIRNAEEIVALHSKVETSLQQYSQLILRPEGQGAFAVQQRPAFESGSSIQSSIR